MTKYGRLFSPLTIKGVTLRNRIAVPPMVQVRPITSAEGLAWYRRLASGGAGLVIVEATNVERFGKDLTAASLGPLTEAIHSGGAAAAIQLFPGPLGRDTTVDGLSRERIEEIIAAFSAAARVCRQAGFDGAEPHGAHSYLLNDFFKPDQNHRTDDFGGSLENRCRMGARLVEAMRCGAGDDFLVGYRHTPTGAEYGIEESLEFAARLVAAGLDFLDVSPACDQEPADLAAPLAAQLDVPVIAVGGMEDPGAAESALRDGRCDLVAVGRQMIADARWPDKVRRGRFDEILACTRCNACHEKLGDGKRVDCALWTTDEVAALIR